MINLYLKWTWAAWCARRHKELFIDYMRAGSDIVRMHKWERYIYLARGDIRLFLIAEGVLPS